jgi:hypothetical protein
MLLQVKRLKPRIDVSLFADTMDEMVNDTVDENQTKQDTRSLVHFEEYKSSIFKQDPHDERQANNFTFEESKEEPNMYETDLPAYPFA